MANTLDIQLTHWDVRLFLEALKELEEKWRYLNQNSLDEDERADVGNDLAALYASREHLVNAAKAVFGESIKTR